MMYDKRKEMMKFHWKGQSWYIDEKLTLSLISLCYNLKKDWDFIILITGDRTVRTGKSVLAMTVCAFLSYTLQRLKFKTDFTLNNLFFSSKKMLDEALKFPNYSIVMYDEGRESLASSKKYSDLQGDILDYFAECGQLNHIFVIVLPDYFTLVEEIAVARSECLLNVYRKDVKILSDVFHDGKKIPVLRFDRGRFEFFNRYTKQRLYDRAKAKRMKSYGLVKPDFRGRFVRQYTVPEEEYKRKKKEWLKRFRERKESEQKKRKTDVFRDQVILHLHNEGRSTKEIKEILQRRYNYGITERWVRKLVSRLAQKREIGGVSVG